MARKKKPQPATAPPEGETTNAPAKAPPISVKKQPLPPDAAKRATKFYQDSREIELRIWRSIYG